MLPNDEQFAAYQNAAQTLFLSIYTNLSVLQEHIAQERSFVAPLASDTTLLDMCRYMVDTTLQDARYAAGIACGCEKEQSHQTDDKIDT